MSIIQVEPCENCGEYDEHTCVVDGVEYGPIETVIEEDLPA